MRIPRLLVSGLSGGTGKTTVSLGLIRAFTRRGLKVAAFKKGPDYIDTAFMGAASRRRPHNLDLFMAPPDKLEETFLRALSADGQTPDLAIIEGNRGLFDGRDLRGSCSSARVAALLAAPVLLTVSAVKMTRTAAALVKGCKEFEPDVRIAGVVLNRVSRERHKDLIRRCVEELAATPVMGALPALSEPPLLERRDGLVFAPEPAAQAELERTLDKLADMVEAHLNLDAILKLAASAPLLPAPPKTAPPATLEGSSPRRLVCNQEQAFPFHYAENIDLLRERGFSVQFQTLAEFTGSLKSAPPNALYLPGPLTLETAPALSANAGLLRGLVALAEKNVPVFAECGGLILFSRNLKMNGRDYPMAGLFNLNAEVLPFPQGLGYIEGSIIRGNPFFPVGQAVRAHEFNYLKFTGPARADALVSLASGRGLGDSEQGFADGLAFNRVFASAFHVYAPGLPAWADGFAAQGPTDR